MVNLLEKEAWDSPLGVSVFFIALGIFILLLSQSKEFNKFETTLLSVGLFLFLLSLSEKLKESRPRI
ncbi:MAG: hypothetical protein QXD62_00375 [Candidatus Woesearchaeota archaeon]